MNHYPTYRRWRRHPPCVCGVWRYDRCPDRPNATGAEPMPPSLAIALAAAVCILLAGLGFGAKMLLGLL